MSGTLFRKLELNKAEKVVLLILLAALVVAATVHVDAVLELLGVPMQKSITARMIAALSNGASIAGVFATFAGIALPGWAVAAVGALGATAA